MFPIRRAIAMDNISDTFNDFNYTFYTAFARSLSLRSAVVGCLRVHCIVVGNTWRCVARIARLAARAKLAFLMKMLYIRRSGGDGSGGISLGRIVQAAAQRVFTYVS